MYHDHGSNKESIEVSCSRKFAPWHVRRTVAPAADLIIFCDLQTLCANVPVMSKPQSFTKPEIMSPAGYWPQLRAAVEAGADAVYFGLKHFSARAKVGFGLEELPEVIQTLHSRGVRGYVTVNTLVFDHELREAARTLAAIAAAGADSIIVQDVAVAGLAREIAPDLEVHGSTQMSITSVEGVELAQLFGVTRVVLARELSLDEVRAIRRRTDCELEMFVHGALCVSYSGQCFSSEAWGGRSANRGQCAQACRLPYELMVDGRRQPLDDKRYLLSPGDLYALRQMPDIIQIGVSALKIEGRYKDANYVALTTAAYRQAVDEAWSGTALTIPEHDELQLAQAYSRGFGPHFVSGTNHQTVVDGRAPRHRGVLAGHVLDLLPDSIVIAPHENHDIAPLKAGDGIVFDAADWRSPEEPEEGGYIYAVTALTHGTLKLEFGNRALDPARIRPGDLVWRTHDHDVEKTARRFTQAAAPVHKQGVHVCVTAHEGEPLMTVWTLVSDADQVVTIVADAPLTSAHNHTLDTGYLFKQLGRLGNTPYMLEQVELEVRGAPFAPASLLNQLRRAAAAQLATQQNRPVARTVRDPDRALDVALEVTTHAVRRRSPAKAHMHLLVRTPEQLEAAISIRPASITLDYLDLYGLRNSVEQVKAADLCVTCGESAGAQAAGRAYRQFSPALGLSHSRSIRWIVAGHSVCRRECRTAATHRRFQSECSECPCRIQLPAVGTRSDNTDP